MQETNAAAESARKTGAQARAVREALGLTLVDVALRSAGEFQPGSLGNLERGIRAFSDATAGRLAAVYGITLDELLHTTGPQLAKLAKQRA